MRPVNIATTIMLAQTCSATERHILNGRLENPEKHHDERTEKEPPFRDHKYPRSRSGMITFRGDLAIIA
jgi:hypothetical protein